MYRFIPQVMSVFAVTFALAGCGMVAKLQRPGTAREVAAPAMTLPSMGAGQTAAALDGSTAAQKAAAVAAPDAAGRVLGTVVVALGSPAEQGFWLKTALVVSPAKGRVVTADGAAVAVDLLPGTGAALLSLAAFRALGLALTDLPEVTVLAE